VFCGLPLQVWSLTILAFAHLKPGVKVGIYILMVVSIGWDFHFTLDVKIIVKMNIIAGRGDLEHSMGF
jgi:hypothetical protein